MLVTFSVSALLAGNMCSAPDKSQLFEDEFVTDAEPRVIQETLEDAQGKCCPEKNAMENSKSDLPVKEVFVDLLDLEPAQPVNHLSGHTVTGVPDLHLLPDKQAVAPLVLPAARLGAA
jgi:hypothetical protein